MKNNQNPKKFPASPECLTQESIQNFYREIGQVCQKYGVSTLVGIWFEGSAGDHYGFIKNHDITDTRMGLISTAIAEKLGQWADSIHEGPQTGYIHETISPPGTKN